MICIWDRHGGSLDEVIGHFRHRAPISKTPAGFIGCPERRADIQRVDGAAQVFCGAMDKSKRDCYISQISSSTCSNAPGSSRISPTS